MQYDVKEFTEKSMGIECPKYPTRITADEVKFITGMVMDELFEFLATVLPPEHIPKVLVEIAINSAKRTDIKTPSGEIETIAEQADAITDIIYYLLNGSAKAGVDIEEVFNEVHKANMAKGGKDGKSFIRNEKGKVMKPKGWTPPDIKAVIMKMRQKGSWEETTDEDD
jgi:predicted HAD superfamily Cof-like phosphohydrolase